MEVEGKGGQSKILFGPTYIYTNNYMYAEWKWATEKISINHITLKHKQSIIILLKTISYFEYEIEIVFVNYIFYWITI